ncbi:murein L,D-transpeptidase catalytic domain family protein [Flavobacterium cellulosilyticum]|uniref:Murein L,D-transpeptidase catalytic domain family protein n=1 Tax=Flavobacterium cellulosilyticum TaxID=2541731 RepID=A0A4R5C4T0_9FLAO|nr:murein L,D-transpeptidase catalytic domain family protein [Flavobacterium cellulosilyticum]TDD93985.1 murein L,D-transpeptidase catalytic domain family protein [Flavobacterium cellulosilyticum]
MIYKIFPPVLFLIFSLFPNKEIPTTSTITINKKPDVSISLEPSSDSNIEMVYDNLHSNQFDLPNLESFKEALKGFYSLKDKGLIQKDILTLVDFSMSSNTKRLWVIDLSTNTILYNSLVAHGRNTGEEYASSFSNSNSSFKSSLGFYVTGETYNGKHGMSLKLDGIEKGINDNARIRGVVMHAADYVSKSFIKCNKRLGRSLGCPAIPEESLKGIVNTIKDKSCLFIYHPSRGPKAFSALFT